MNGLRLSEKLPPGEFRPEPDVRLRLAGPRNLPLARVMATGVAVRAGLDTDSVADFTLAVDEACAMLVSRAAPDHTVDCAFAVDEDAIEVAVSVRADTGDAVDRAGIGWVLLSALTDEVIARSTDNDGGHWVTVEFRVAR